VEELYLAALSRPPSKEEREFARRHIAKSNNRAVALADVCWAILNTNEFVFQH